MKLNKILRVYVRLSRFATEQNLAPRDVAELVALANAVFRRNVDACNYPDRERALEGARKRLEAFASQLGYTVEYDSGLWPTLSKNGERIELPGD